MGTWRNWYTRTSQKRMDFVLESSSLSVPTFEQKPPLYARGFCLRNRVGCQYVFSNETSLPSLFYIESKFSALKAYRYNSTLHYSFT